MTDWDALRTEALAASAPEFVKGALSDRYLQPPYSVLDTKKGDWLTRRSWWLALGMRSEEGRGADYQPPPGQEYERSAVAAKKMRARGGAARFMDHDLMRGETTNVALGGKAPNGAVESAAGTSIFDPVLCELMYRWWCPAGGSILDPFAGGSVRGIVAAMLGHPYTGIELRPEQVASNRDQAAAILPPDAPVPEWVVGDATELPTLLEAGVLYDMVFTCPPYYDLEVYSDDARDLSAAPSYAEFLELYRTVAQHSLARLRHGRHAVWVVSDVRGEDGAYYGLVADTVAALVAAGGRYYNEAILLNAVGSAALRAERYFSSNRKLVRMHQNIVDVVKGEVERGWDATRAGPPDPQLSLVLDGTAVELPPADFALIDTIGDPAPAGAPVVIAQPPSPPQPAPPVPVVAPAPTVTPLRAAASESGRFVTVEVPGGTILMYRDDLFVIGGANGGKARSIASLVDAADPRPTGLVTAASRTSVQIGVVARLARHYGMACRVYVPTGASTPEMEVVRQAGAQLEQVEPGYTSVLTKRATDYAHGHPGYLQIPWGLECPEHVAATSAQVAGLPWGTFSRIVVPVGSGMSLAGVVAGVAAYLPDLVDVEVVGVQVGADPSLRLEKWVGPAWRNLVTIVGDGDYHHPAGTTRLGPLELDPYYEAKCIKHLRAGDLLWVVGSRLVPAPATFRWVCTTCQTSNPSGYVAPRPDGGGRGMCYTCGDFTTFVQEVRP